MNSDYLPDPRTLIPHRPPLHFIDAVHVTGPRATATRTITPDHPFTRHGMLLRAALVEMLSQCAACAAAARAAAAGTTLARGMLVAARELVFCGDAAVGDTVTLIAERQSTDMFHHTDEVVQLAVTFMLRNLKEAPKVQTMAEHAGVSKCTLETRFRTCTGKSPHEYLTAARIEHAMKLLQSPSQNTLQGIASTCGFQSYPAFLKAFRAINGTSPKAYQRSLVHPWGS